MLFKYNGGFMSKLNNQNINVYTGDKELKNVSNKRNEQVKMNTVESDMINELKPSRIKLERKLLFMSTKCIIEQ